MVAVAVVLVEELGEEPVAVSTQLNTAAWTWTETTRVCVCGESVSVTIMNVMFT